MRKSNTRILTGSRFVSRLVFHAFCVKGKNIALRIHKLSMGAFGIFSERIHTEESVTIN